MASVRLRVNGREYAGWKSATVTRGIEAVAGGFELAFTDRWSPGGEPWPIRRGDACTLLVGDTPVITGYVDRNHIAFDASEHTLEVSGRDRTADLVDCSALLKDWEFANTPVLTVARKLAEPLGVSVRLAPGVDPGKPAAKLTANPGDTVFEVLERACRTAGLLATSDGAGGLVLMRPGAARAHTALIEGEEGNILAASATFDQTDRYARYVVLGQHKATDDFWAKPARGVRAEARDANVERAHRVLLVRPEGNVTAAQAKRRVEWEATVRAARADSVSVTVRGWTQGDGSIWPVNALVHVRSSYLGIDGELLIAQTEFGLSDTRGTTTRLTLRHPDAFKPEPVIPKGKKGAGSSWAGILS